MGLPSSNRIGLKLIYSGPVTWPR